MTLDFLTPAVFSSVLDNLQDGVYVVSPDRRIIYWNKAAETITGYAADEIVGKFCHENLLRHVDEKGTPLCVVGCPLFQTLGDGETRRGEVFLRHKEGYRLPIITQFLPITDQETGKVEGALEIFTLASPQSYESGIFERLENRSMYDSLTQLPNRHYVESELGYRLEQLRRFKKTFCILFIDIDNFRSFNNTYGHAAGDKVLTAISESIRHGLRQGDLFGRWGGEEFIGVFEYKTEEELSRLAERVRALVLNTQIKWEDNDLSVTISGGLSCGRKEDTIETLVARADALMYRSKDNGKDQITLDT